MEITPTNFDQPISSQAESPKIFREKAIFGGAFLGGPLAVGYIMANNFKVFGEPQKVKRTWIISILSTLLIFGIVLNLPTSVKIPNQLIPLIYSAIAYALMHFYQGKQIDTYLQQGGKWFSGWRVAGIGAIALVVTGVSIFSYVYFSDPILSASTKSYGVTKNEIVYKSSNISGPELDKISGSLTSIGFFNDEVTNSIYVRKTNNDYEIVFPLINHSWEQPETLKYFESMREAMQPDFPSNHIVFKISSDEDVEDVKKEFR